MPHKIPIDKIENLTKGPSQSKIQQVSNLQNYIQKILGETHHTFLQGSYVNHTAIADINDVDIVAVRKETSSGTFSPNASPNNPKIQWDIIFSEIENKLKNQELYKWTITRGDKCIKIEGAFRADIIPAVKYVDEKEDPIVIYSWKNQREQISHPREHIVKSTTKHDETDKQYKPMVRMFKNWLRNHFQKEPVSSFKIQALIHSVDKDNFSADQAANFLLIGYSILSKLNTSEPMISSVCGMENIIPSWDIGSRIIFSTQLNKSLEHALAAYKATSVQEAEAKWRLALGI